MVDQFRIEVVIDPARARAGARAVRGELRGVETAAGRLESLLRRAFAFVGLTAAARQITQLADAFTNAQNRLRVVTASSAELTLVQGELFRIANRTRTSFEGVVELYTRTALAAEELGRSQGELLRFTEAVNQAVVISGAGAQEARGALIQLAQGIGAEALRGQELNSVLEQTPVIARAIADELDVSVGRLRLLGEEGRITADVVINALLSAGESLNETFEKTIPTISQSFTVLRNRTLEYVGNANEATGASQAFSQFILFLAENINDLARVAIAAGTALGVSFAVRGVGTAVAALRTLAATLLTNPLTALPAVIALAAGALVGFGDEISIAADKTTNLQDLARATFEEIQVLATGIVPPIEEAFQALSDELGGVFGEIDLSIQGILQITATVADRTLGLFTGLGNAILALFAGLGPAAADLFIQSVNGFLSFLESGLDNTSAFFATVTETAQQVGSSILNLFRELNVASTLLLQGSVAAAEQFAREAVETFSNQLGNSLDTFNDRFRSNLQELSADDTVPRLENSFEGAATDLGQAVLDGFLEGLDVTLVRGVLNDIIIRADAAAAAAARAAENAPDGGLDFAATSSTGVAGGDGEGETFEFGGNEVGDLDFVSFADDINLAADATDRLTQSQLDLSTGIGRARLAAEAGEVIFGSLEDTIVNFARTGEFSVSALIDSIIADLTRLFVRKALLEIFNALFGDGSGGGSAGLITNLLGGAAENSSGVDGSAQAGASVAAGQTFLVGEEGPELFTSQQSGEIIPAGETAAIMEGARGGGAGPSVNVSSAPATVVFVDDPSKIPTGIQSPAGQQAVIQVVQQNRRRLQLPGA